MSSEKSIKVDSFVLNHVTFHRTESFMDYIDASDNGFPYWKKNVKNRIKKLIETYLKLALSNC